MGRRLRHFSKEVIQMAERHMKRGSTSLSSYECKLKPQWGIILYLSEGLSFKRSRSNKCWWACGQDCWWEMSTGAAPMDNSKEVPPNLNRELANDPAMPLLGVYLKKNGPLIWMVSFIHLDGTWRLSESERLHCSSPLPPCTLRRWPRPSPTSLFTKRHLCLQSQCEMKREPLPATR